MIFFYFQRCRNATDKLIKIYNDESGERAKEIQAIGGPNEFAEFYSRLKSLKDIHRKNPNETARPLTIEFQEMANFVQDPDKIEREMVRFTDEEGYGKFLDMHTLYEQYVNLKGVKVYSLFFVIKRIYLMEFFIYIGELNWACLNLCLIYLVNVLDLDPDLTFP